VADQPKQGRNYEDLKAKLGLKKTGPDAADNIEGGAEGAIGEPPSERTPAAGFDLGLERGGAVMDSAVIDVDKAANLITEGGSDLTVKKSPGMRILMIGILLVSLGAAFGVGYAVQGTQYDRLIEERQTEDATTLRAAVTGAKTLKTGDPLTKTVDDFVAVVNQVDKKVQQVLKAKDLTPRLLSSVEAQLRQLHKASATYAATGPFMDPKSAIAKAVFNGEAIKKILEYDALLKNLYYASLAMASEDAIFEEFKAAANVDNIKPASKVRAWRWATVKDKNERPTGYLVGVDLMTNPDGTRKFRKQPIEVPPGRKLPPGAPTFRWQTQVKYDNPKQVGGAADGWVDTDIVVTWDLRDDIGAATKEQVTQHHELYKIMLLRRLFARVAALKAAADPMLPARNAIIEKLSKLAHDE